MAQSERIRVLILPELGFFVAQCLEFDIAAQGSTIEEVMGNFSYAVLAHFDIAEERGEEPLEHVEPAPDFYVALYEKGQKLRDFEIDGQGIAGEKRYSARKPAAKTSKRLKPRVAEVSLA